MATNEPELSYELDGFRFGTGSKYIVTDVDYGAAEIITNDSPLPRADGVRFGRDYRVNRNITFSIVVDQSPHRNNDLALDLLARLETAWLADGVRNSPGAVSTLRMTRNGRTRRVYGRPREFATLSERSKGGWVYATAQFATVDPYYYEDQEENNTVSIVPTPGGGLLAPLDAPLSTLAVSYGPGEISIGGTLPVWPVFIITGPINRPGIEVVGEWKFDLDVNLAHDAFITIDTRPWSRGVRHNNVTNIAGRLNAAARRLSDMRLKPGPHEVVLFGEDDTGQASMTIAWRNTYPTY